MLSLHPILAANNRNLYGCQLGHAHCFVHCQKCGGCSLSNSHRVALLSLGWFTNDKKAAHFVRELSPELSERGDISLFKEYKIKPRKINIFFCMYRIGSWELTEFDHNH